MANTAPKPRRWLMPALAVSLALNLLVVGVAAGSFWRFKEFGPDKRGGAPSAILFLRALDPEDRKAIFAELRSSRDAGRALERQSRSDTLAALRAEPFDHARMEELLAGRVARSETAKAALDAKWLEIVTAMSPEERAVYADRLQKAFDRHRARRPKPQAD